MHGEVKVEGRHVAVLAPTLSPCGCEQINVPPGLAARRGWEGGDGLCKGIVYKTWKLRVGLGGHSKKCRSSEVLPRSGT